MKNSYITIGGITFPTHTSNGITTIDYPEQPPISREKREEAEKNLKFLKELTDKSIKE